MDETLGDFSTADILVEEGAIQCGRPSLDGGDAETIDAAGMIALPGIIDAHTCLWQTVLRGYVPYLWPGAYYSAFLPLRIRFTGRWWNFNAPGSAASRCCPMARPPSSITATTSAVPPSRRPRWRRLKKIGIRQPLPVFIHAGGAGRVCRAAGSPGRRPARLRRVPRSQGPHHHWLRHRLDRRTELEKQLAFARGLKAPSCIHVNEACTIDKLANRGLLAPICW